MEEEEEEREMDSGALLSSFGGASGSFPMTVLPTFKIGLSTSGSLFWKCPGGHSQRLGSYVILSYVKLSWNKDLAITASKHTCIVLWYLLVCCICLLTFAGHLTGTFVMDKIILQSIIP